MFRAVGKRDGDVREIPRLQEPEAVSASDGNFVRTWPCGISGAACYGCLLGEVNRAVFKRENLLKRFLAAAAAKLVGVAGIQGSSHSEI